MASPLRTTSIALRQEPRLWWSYPKLNWWSISCFRLNWLMMEITKMLKTSVISFSCVFTSLTDAQLTPCKLRQSTSCRLPTRKWENCTRFAPRFSNLTRAVACTWIPRARPSWWTLLLEATCNRACTSRQETSSRRLPSLKIQATVSLPDTCTTLAASRPCSLSTQQPRPVWSKPWERGLRLGPLVSEFKLRSCLSLLSCWWEKSLRDLSSRTKISRSTWHPTCKSWTVSNRERWRNSIEFWSSMLKSSLLIRTCR